MKTVIVTTIPDRDLDQTIELPPFAQEFTEETIDWNTTRYDVPNEIFDRFIDALDNDPVCESYVVEKNPAAVALGRLGGKSTSEAKRKAVRENGKRGGRPKTK
jgi:hypothetical protein